MGHQNTLMDDLTRYDGAAKKAYLDFYGQPYRTQPSVKDADHIRSIGRSIMLHRDGILTGGGFVTAVCANDLDGAIQKADSVCWNNLPFFVHCKLHVRPIIYAQVYP